MSPRYRHDFHFPWVGRRSMGTPQNDKVGRLWRKRRGESASSGPPKQIPRCAQDDIVGTFSSICLVLGYTDTLTIGVRLASPSGQLLATVSALSDRGLLFAGEPTVNHKPIDRGYQVTVFPIRGRKCPGIRRRGAAVANHPDQGRTKCRNNR
jgi:hypothetical protein